jgi:hypothetical protein
VRKMMGRKRRSKRAAPAAVAQEVPEGDLDLRVEEGILKGPDDRLCIAGRVQDLSRLPEQCLVEQDAGTPLRSHAGLPPSIVLLEWLNRNMSCRVGTCHHAVARLRRRRPWGAGSTGSTEGGGPRRPRRRRRQRTCGFSLTRSVRCR